MVLFNTIVLDRQLVQLLPCGYA